LEEINRQGTTIIMVTHDPELAARAHRNVHIIDGQVTDFDDEPRLAEPARGDNSARVATA
ncbi:MAG: ABC transporter ATP-binding protein, partial [Rhodanobacteraceae bacterium]